MSTLKPNAPTPGPWTVGRERILELIESGELERVVVNREHAQGLLLRAQRGPHDAVGKLYSRLRRTRHEVEYPGLDYEPIAVEEAEEALEDAEYIVQEMTLFIPKLGPF